LFAYIGSLRDPAQIAALGAASLARVLRLETSQLWTWNDHGSGTGLALWQAPGTEHRCASVDEITAARELVAPAVACQRVDLRGRERAAAAAAWVAVGVTGFELDG